MVALVDLREAFERDGMCVVEHEDVVVFFVSTGFLAKLFFEQFGEFESSRDFFFGLISKLSKLGKKG